MRNNSLVIEIFDLDNQHVLSQYINCFPYPNSMMPKKGTKFLYKDQKYKVKDVKFSYFNFPEPKVNIAIVKVEKK